MKDGAIQSLGCESRGRRLYGSANEQNAQVSANPSKFRPFYHPSRLSKRFMTGAAFLDGGKYKIGLEAAFTDTPGLNWDTHVNQAIQNGSRGQLANLLRIFSQGLAAFALDLGRRMDDVILLTMSEFGRTARENGSRGTDHGLGNEMIAIGHSVKGGKVYGDWEGLRAESLDRGRYLAVTTDFRDVLGEVTAKHLGGKDLDGLFPRYSIDPVRFRGFIG